MKFITFLLIFIVTLSAEVNSSKDPYQNIEMFKLKNGLDVVLLPDSRAKNIKITITVKAGMIEERANNLEITHLLEHLLFRDSSLPKDITYLQLIEEKGGSANGYTTLSNTSYLATIPSQHTNWLLDVFSKMVFERDIEKNDIKKEIQTIKLELGEPDWLAKKVGFDILNWLNSKLFEMPDFAEVEFGIKYDYSRHSVNDRVMSLEHISYEDILEYYKSYYNPSNSTLFLSGNFDKEKIIPQIKEKFGKFKSTKSKSAKILEPNFVEKNYKKIYSYGKKSEATYGIKFNKASGKDEVVLISYNNYLAHRLMKELRNNKGETYTVYNVYQGYNDYKNASFAGVVGITYETSKEKFWTNLDYIKKKIKDETIDGKLNDEMVKESIKLYRQKYELTSPDAETLMIFAQNYYYKSKVAKKETNYYQLLNSLNPDEYRDILKKYYSTNTYYESYNRPKLYSSIEEEVIFGVSFLFALWLFSIIFKRKVECVNITYIKELTHSPIFLLEFFGIFVVAFVVYMFVLVRVEFFFENQLWYNNLELHLYYYYIFTFISIVLFIGFFFSLISLMPKTIIVENSSLVIKSMNSYAKKYNKEEIDYIEIMSPFKLIKRPKIWFNSKFKIGVYDIFLWRDRLLIKLKNNAYYYLAVNNAKKTKEELEGKLQIDSGN